MTPAYADDRVTVYHCDAVELAAHLRATGVVCDAMIVDAPYSERTHAGHNSNLGSHAGCDDPGKVTRRAVEYAPWSAHDVDAFATSFLPVVDGWAISITDHVLAPAWFASMERAGLYVFAPIACTQPGSRIRLSGDGPAQWSTWAVVARPKSVRFSRWGSLPGAYICQPEPMPWIGGKPVALIRALVRDYSRPGDLIVDPCCGAGTLGVAVRYEGRKAILADKDPFAVETTIKRLRGERTKPVRTDVPADADHALALFRPEGVGSHGRPTP